MSKASPELINTKAQKRDGNDEVRMTIAGSFRALAFSASWRLAPDSGSAFPA
jgi:hypothetical protein